MSFLGITRNKRNSIHVSGETFGIQFLSSLKICKTSSSRLRISLSLHFRHARENETNLSHNIQNITQFMNTFLFSYLSKEGNHLPNNVGCPALLNSYTLLIAHPIFTVN